MNLTRAANGDIVKGDVEYGKRTPAYIQTDFTLRHEIIVSKEHENRRLSIEANVTNLFNQRSATVFYEFMVPTANVTPARASRFSGDPQIDWGKVMTSYNYIDALNGTGAFAGTVPGSSTKITAQPFTLASRYGMPSGWQNARTIRMTLRFTF